MKVLITKRQSSLKNKNKFVIAIWAGVSSFPARTKRLLRRLVKLQSLVAKCCKMRKIYIALQSLKILYTFVPLVEIPTTFFFVIQKYTKFANL